MGLFRPIKAPLMFCSFSHPYATNPPLPKGAAVSVQLAGLRHHVRFAHLPQLCPSHLPRLPITGSAFIAGVWLHARTRGGRECRSHGLFSAMSVCYPSCLFRIVWIDVSIQGDMCIPGPLTFRMIERVWSSMNSTRTWVTPPREPNKMSLSSAFDHVAILASFLSCPSPSSKIRRRYRGSLLQRLYDLNGVSYRYGRGRG